MQYHILLVHIRLGVHRFLDGSGPPCKTLGANLFFFCNPQLFNTSNVGRHNTPSTLLFMDLGRQIVLFKSQFFNIPNVGRHNTSSTFLFVEIFVKSTASQQFQRWAPQLSTIYFFQSTTTFKHFMLVATTQFPCCTYARRFLEPIQLVQFSISDYLNK